MNSLQALRKDSRKTTLDAEEAMLGKALEKHGWHLAKSAKALHIQPSNLSRLIQRHPTLTRQFQEHRGFRRGRRPAPERLSGATAARYKKQRLELARKAMETGGWTTTGGAKALGVHVKTMRNILTEFPSLKREYRLKKIARQELQ